MIYLVIFLGSAPQLAATVRALQEAVTVLPVVQWGMRGGMEHLLVCVTAQVWHERRESKDKYFLLDFSSLSHVPSFHLPFRWLSSYPPMCPCSVLNPCSLWVTSSKFCCSLCWRLRDLALFLTCLLIWIQVWAALPFPSTPSLTELQQTPFLTGCSGSHSVSWRLGGRELAGGGTGEAFVAAQWCSEATKGTLITVKGVIILWIVLSRLKCLI